MEEIVELIRVGERVQLEVCNSALWYWERDGVVERSRVHLKVARAELTDTCRRWSLIRERGELKGTVLSAF